MKFDIEQEKNLMNFFKKSFKEPVNVMVIGNYGNNNFGDKIILYSLYKLLKETKKIKKIIIPTSNPDRVMLEGSDVEILDMASKFNLIKNLISVDLVIIGGGGIFSAYTGKKAKLIPLFTLIAKLLGKKVIYYGIGIYSTASPAEKKLLGVSLNVSNLICVRDDDSYKTVTKLTSNKVNLIEDLVYYLKFDKDKNKKFSY